MDPSLIHVVARALSCRWSTAYDPDPYSNNFPSSSLYLMIAPELLSLVKSFLLPYFDTVADGKHLQCLAENYSAAAAAKTAEALQADLAPLIVIDRHRCSWREEASYLEQASADMEALDHLDPAPCAGAEDTAVDCHTDHWAVAAVSPDPYRSFHSTCMALEDPAQNH